VKWKNVNVTELRKEFETKCPVIVDQSTEVDSTDANVEKKEIFTCFFPDGTLDKNLGGFDSRDAFKEYVDRMQQDGNFDISVRLDLEKTFANGDDSDLLVCSSLLQFPYGRGGMNKTWVLDDGSYSDKADTEKYLKHLNRLSEIEFQEPMFKLIAYSMCCKIKLLRSSRLQLKGKQTASTLANGLTSDDLATAVRGRSVGNQYAGSKASQTLLNAVDACSQSLPHTNETLKRARSTGESMQHHFGVPSFFMTATFDNKNSLLVQILHGTEIDMDVNLSELTDNDLAARCSQCNTQELHLRD
jgi:hypothetical protein